MDFKAQTLKESKKLVKDSKDKCITFRPVVARVGGKFRIAKKIVELIPPHITYVEPFIGGGSVFLKQQSEKEIINDKDRDIYHIWIDIKAIGNRINEMAFICNRKTFKTLLASKPSNKFERLFRNLYISTFSFSGNRIGFVGEKECRTRKNPGTNLRKMGAAYKDRLKNVKIFNKDYRTIIKKFDGTDTFFYFDPPYETLSGDWGFTPIKPDDIYKAVKDIKGKFILSYENSDNIKKLFKGNKYRISSINTLYQLSGVRQKITELLIMNF